MAPDLRFLTRLGPADPVPDAELLRRFAAGDGPAFELLVRRHAGLVWRVCRSALAADTHAAEDAFQASFLALARHASRVRGASAAGWLARVARHAALRRRRFLRPIAPLPADVPATDTTPDSGEVLAEVNRLPGRLREPVLLCLLEGCSHAEAAARLNLPVGTLASRLSRAKVALRGRLLRRGLAPALLTVAAPPDVVRAGVAVGLASSSAPPVVSTLAAGAVSAMSTAFRLKVAAGLLLAAGAVSLSLSAAQTPKPAAPTDDLAKLQGKWRVVSMKMPGGEVADDDVKGVRWEFRGDQLITWEGPNTLHRDDRRVKLDAAKSPRWIDLNGTDLGVYALAGDRLTVCLRFPSAVKKLGRPTAFTADAGATVVELVRDSSNTPAEKPLPPPKPAAAPADELAKLQGKWRVVRRSVADQESDTTSATITIAGDRVVTTEGSGDKTPLLTMALEPTHSPRRVELTAPAGQGEPLIGIYKLDGDRLTFCVRPKDFVEKFGRPTAFEVGGGSVVMVLERGDGPPPVVRSETEAKLIGEWQQPMRMKAADDTLLVWTFRDTGVYRIDYLEQATGKVNCDPAAPGPMVGRWRVEGTELVLEHEGWVGENKRPRRTVERLPLESVPADKLVVRRLPDPRGTRWVTDTYTRFPGWDKVKP